MIPVTIILLVLSKIDVLDHCGQPGRLAAPELTTSLGPSLHSFWQVPSECEADAARSSRGLSCADAGVQARLDP